jgi:hypothetical protein
LLLNTTPALEDEMSRVPSNKHVSSCNHIIDSYNKWFLLCKETHHLLNKLNCWQSKRKLGTWIRRGTTLKVLNSSKCEYLDWIKQISCMSFRLLNHLLVKNLPDYINPIKVPSSSLEVYRKPNLFIFVILKSIYHKKDRFFDRTCIRSMWVILNKIIVYFGKTLTIFAWHFRR